jgi:hypothetical protein
VMSEAATMASPITMWTAERRTEDIKRD